MSDVALRSKSLPVGSFGRLASGWFGVWCLVATEGSIFAYLIFSYFYLASQAVGQWPPNGVPVLRLAGPNTDHFASKQRCFDLGGAQRSAPGRSGTIAGRHCSSVHLRQRLRRRADYGMAQPIDLANLRNIRLDLFYVDGIPSRPRDRRARDASAFVCMGGARLLQPGASCPTHDRGDLLAFRRRDLASCVRDTLSVSSVRIMP